MLPKPRHSGLPGRPYLVHRTVMNGIFWVLCSGVPWRDFPERYGHWNTVYNRFNYCFKLAVIDLIFNRLLKFLDEQGQIDWQSISIDGSHIRALKAAAGAKKFR